MQQNTTLILGKAFLSLIFLVFFSNFTSAFTACEDRTVSNTIHCNNGTEYAVWLKRSSGGASHFKGNSYSFTECNDGTATFTATGLTSSSAPGEVIDVTITYSGKTTDTPSGSPKNNRCASTDASDWIYYVTTTGTITSSLHGTYEVSRRGPAFQLGMHANETGIGFGASGWFHLNNGDGYWQVGDVNIMLSGGDDPVNNCTAALDELVFHSLSGGSDSPLQNGGTYSTATLPNSWNIEAKTSGSVKKVVFELSGDASNTHTENYDPYRYRGDNNALNLSGGTYTLKVKVYGTAPIEICDEQEFSFTLIEECNSEITALVINDLDGGSDITLIDGATYGSGDLPNRWNIEALINGQIGSVKFQVTGDLNDTHTENQAPYRYRGDNNNLNLGAGTYTISASAFKGRHASGTLCDEEEITFTIEETCTGVITDFLINDLSGNSDIVLVDNGAYTADQIPASWNIEVLTTGGVESIRFEVSGATTGVHTENHAPYRYRGDNNPVNIGLGTQTLIITAKAYSQNRLEGVLCDQRTITITVTQECTGTIESLKINDLNGGDDLVITDGSTIKLTDLPASWNLEAHTSGQLESIKFIATGDYVKTHTENHAPYRLKGDNNPLNLGEGSYTIRMQAYSGNHTSGELCDEQVINFTIEPESVCDNATDGGQIGLGVGGLYTEEEICNPCAAPIIQNVAAPSGGSGAMEVVWIKRAGASISDCQDAFSLMQPYNVGQLYDDFKAGNGSAQIGDTGWEFVTDGDSDDLSLTLTCLEESTCFLRCTRREGCLRFGGESNLVRINVNDVEGGNIGIEVNGAPVLTSTAICAGDPVPVIGNAVAPKSNNGEEIEVVWIRTEVVDGVPGQEQFEELAAVNVGQLYNNYKANPAVGPYIFIPGSSTVWEFVTDGDADDNSLALASLDKSYHFIRCVRELGDTRFCGESFPLPVTIYVDNNCAPADNNPCTYERCNGIVTITGAATVGINSIKVLDPNAGLASIFECGTFLANQCDNVIEVTLPNPSGSYVLAIICDDGNHYDYINETCGTALAQNTGFNLNNDRQNKEQGVLTTTELNVTEIGANTEMKFYPNPATTEAFLKLDGYGGKTANLNITNSVGQRVFAQGSQTLSDEAIQLDLSQLESGMYFITVEVDEKVVFKQRFVLAK